MLITSDFHFNHKNIIKYCSRPFSSTEDMDEFIINEMNTALAEDPVICFGGDFSFGPRSLCEKYLERLNYREFHWVLGNHDNRNECLKLVEKGLVTSLYPRYAVFGNLVVSHYPMSEEDKKLFDEDKVFVHGHKHSLLPSDIGVDGNNFKPYTLEEAIARLSIQT